MKQRYQTLDALRDLIIAIQRDTDHSIAVTRLPKADREYLVGYRDALAFLLKYPLSE